jgi:hypothetical protein
MMKNLKIVLRSYPTMYKMNSLAQNWSQQAVFQASNISRDSVSLYNFDKTILRLGMFVQKSKCEQYCITVF